MKVPWFKFFAVDWLADVQVRLMSLAQRGLYIDLLAYQWREGSLPSQPAELRKLAGVASAEWRIVWKMILVKRFPVDPDGLRRNPRLESIRREFIQKSTQAASAAAAKWSDIRATSDIQAANDPSNGPSKPSSRSGLDADASLPHMPDRCVKRSEVDLDQKKEEERERSAPARRPVWWNEGTKQIEYTEKWITELKAAFMGELGAAVMRQKWKEARRWFLKHPHRRSRRSRMDRTLYTFFETAIRDELAKEEAKQERAEERGSKGRVVPRTPAPECPDCRQPLTVGHDCSGGNDPEAERNERLRESGRAGKVEGGTEGGKTTNGGSVRKSFFGD